MTMLQMSVEPYYIK